jgi:predicted RNA-binding protein with RPS1 domain
MSEARKADAEEDDSDDPVKKEKEEFTVGKILDQVKVKEINYFDSKPILSIRESLLKTESLSFDTLKVGQFFQAVIEKVVLEKNYIQLSINGFVKGNLHIEHMADNAIKQMPPKFLEVGKDIRVRVLSVNPSKRSLEFTKKDSLMKEDAPVFQSYKDIKRGEKLVGVVVAQNTFGYVITTFGNIKGLLNFDDIEEKSGKGFDKTAYKVGSIVKAYVLFKKKDKGVALTLSKKKAKADKEDDKEDQSMTLESSFLPNDEELEKIVSNEKYSTMIKSTRDPTLVGQVNLFRILNEHDNFYVLKSLDASKKSKNFIGLLPKCFISSQNVSHPDFTCKGLILDQFRGQIPIVSIQPELIELKEEMTLKTEELTSGSTYIGVVNGIVGKSGAISVRFMGGKQKIVKVKDLNTTQEYKKIYAIGKVIRVAVNKLGRLCTKSKVIDACVESTEADKVV